MKLGLLGSLVEGSLDGHSPRFHDLRALAQAAEAIGLDSFWAWDHLLYRDPHPETGCWEAFTFLSALAASTSRLTLGPLVACTAFRPPALLAKMADSLDEIQRGPVCPRPGLRVARAGVRGVRVPVRSPCCTLRGGRAYHQRTLAHGPIDVPWAV